MSEQVTECEQVAVCEEVTVSEAVTERNVTVWKEIMVSEEIMMIISHLIKLILDCSLTRNIIRQMMCTIACCAVAIIFE